MSAFTKAVAHYLDGLHVATGAAPGCEACGLADVDSMEDPRYDLAGEPSYSKSQCDSCGTMMHGDRHPAHGTDAEGRIYHLDICTDCLFYLANGQEPEEWYPSARVRREAELAERPINWDAVPWVDSRYYDDR